MQAGVNRPLSLVAWVSRLTGAPDPVARLMAGYQEGDAAAFQELHAALRPELGAHLLALGADEDALDALLDQVFLQIHAARRTWSPGFPVEPWAKAIAAHVLRRTERRSGLRTRLAPLNVSAPAADGRNLEV